MHNDPERIFETERLYVRHFNDDDLDDFAALCADVRVMIYVGDSTPLPRSEVERWIGICKQKYAAYGYGTSAVFEKKSGRFIGCCGVVRAPNRDFDEIIYAYHSDTWGKGYATEAARAMLDYVFARSTLDRIYATIDPRNTPSINVAHKVGMHYEREELDDDGIPTAFYVTSRRMNIEPS